jgi:RNA polymerase sigma factor (TIGR02999 family)
VTRLLEAAAAGRDVFDQIFERVYQELHTLAHRVRAGRAGETLNTTALVHEAYVKLVPSAASPWESRRHFFGVAARAMRQILVSAARRRMAAKRGGEQGWAVTFDEAVHRGPVRAGELLALDHALERLDGFDPRRARVVELRYFAGLSIDETARALALSTATVERDWRAARAWLGAEVAGASPP